MKTIISAIEQETKHVKDSLEGGRQYRKGYAQALEAVSAFLIGQSGERSVDESENPAVQRLFAFQSEGFPDWPKPLDLLDTMTPAERKTVEIALAVIRNHHEFSDYLLWWLHNFGIQALCPGDPSCPIFPDRAAPSLAELDALEAELDLVVTTF